MAIWNETVEIDKYQVTAGKSHDLQADSSASM
jgi:hypothetical protein